MTAPPLQRFRVRNFKAVRDSGELRFGWLTAYIGNNGSGKSSIVEGLETFRDIVADGLDHAMRRWHGFQHIWNHAVKHIPSARNDDRPSYTNPLEFEVFWDGGASHLQQTVNTEDGGNTAYIESESLRTSRPHEIQTRRRDARGHAFVTTARNVVPGEPLPWVETDLFHSDTESLHKVFAEGSVNQWQFLSLDPNDMGEPSIAATAGQNIRLAKDARNLAEYLSGMRKADADAFAGLVDAIRFVLPFTAELSVEEYSGVGRSFYLRMQEGDFEVPGWLLSSGTLRIVALLACLRHPQPPRLLIVEEIENGLDPRTVNLLVEELRAAAERKSTQVIFTTHSPYLLDLLDLSHIVVVEREEGQPVFRRPADREDLRTWAESFAPGSLYTMGRLTNGR